MWQQKQPSIVYLDGQPLIVEKVTTKQDQTKGLSGRSQLAKGHGMLFEFDGPTRESCIWMKDMRFNIDVYWFDTTGRMISSESNMAPNSFPKILCPQLPAAFVVEVPAGQYETPPKLLKQ